MAHIRTFLRIKPSTNTFEDFDLSGNTLYLRVPEPGRESHGTISTRGNPTVNHEFKFSSAFSQAANQNEVFENVAKPVIQGFLEGYNGTIFAYGQTGSGKTFTVEGSARRYEDRGLAPRAISMIYKHLESHHNEDIQVHISYMEIYQEVGYDLLNQAARNSSQATPFPKVAVVEGPRSSCIIRNLSNHLAANEDVAQNLLHQGQANRKVAETPMNQRSSRSHAVFTVQVTIKRHDSDTITKSKLHLVDLAGSERVSKTGIQGLQLSEAKFINLSLHHLEGVIIALQHEANGTQPRARPQTPNYAMYNRWVNSLRPQSADGFLRARPNSAGYSSQTAKHIPYRNSLLTMVLRDSLGGNCQTAMIATISMEEDNLNETVSTCRFAQRVACITNLLQKNEEIDDRSMIRRLRKRIAELETEISLLRSGQEGTVETFDGKLTDEDKLSCAKIMQAYLGGRIRDPITAGVTNPGRFRECLRILKMMIMEHYAREGEASLPRALSDNHRPAVEYNQEGSTTDNRTHSNNKRNTEKHQATILRAGAGKVEQMRTAYKAPSSKQDLVPAEDGVLLMPKAAWGNEDGDSMRPNVGSRASSAIASKAGMGTGHKIRSGSAGSTRSEAGPQHNRIGSASSTRSGTEIEKARKEYKTPFEKKREAEIKRLDKKVSKAQSTASEEKQQLKETQADLKIQQLDVIKNELKKKIQTTREQVKEQHEYLKKLKHGHADLDIYQEEKLVEKQLRKRQIKMERRLLLVQEQLNVITKHKENMGRVTETKEEKSHLDRTHNAFLCSIEEKYPQYVRKDGKINSKQVLDVLKVQEKETEKLQSRLEGERIAVLSKQIELKEAATRQKLLDFKEKLRLAKMGKVGQQASKSESATNNLVTTINGQMKSEAGESDMNHVGEGAHLSEKTQGKPSTNVQLVPTKEMVFSGAGGRDIHTESGQNAFLVKLQSRAGRSRPGTAQSSADLMEQWSQNVRDKKKAEDKWDENYCRKTPSLEHPNNTHITASRPVSAVSVLPVNMPGYDETPRVGISEQPQHINGDISDPLISESNESFHSMTRRPGGKANPFSSDSRESLGQNWRSEKQSQVQEDSTDTFFRASRSRNKQSIRNQFRSESNESSSAERSAFTIETGWTSRDSSKDKQGSRENSKEKYRSPENSTEKYSSRDHSKESQRCQEASRAPPLTNGTLDNTFGESFQINTQTEDKSHVPNHAFEGNLSDYEKGIIRHRPQSCSQEEGFDESFEKMLPSEYVNQDHEESFDGRKMGLSQQTFDEALNKMLGEANMDPEAPLTYVHEQYNEFARVPRNTSQTQPKIRDRTQSAKVPPGGQSVKAPPGAQSAKVPPGRQSAKAPPGSQNEPHRSPYATKESQFRPKSSAVPTWGPEARSLSISERLAKYLDMDSHDHSAKSGKSYEDTDVQPVRRSRIAIEDETVEGPIGEWKKNLAKNRTKPDLDLDSFAPKIHALADDEREDTYMRSAREQQDRVKRIRKARHAAEIIQGAWRDFLARKSGHLQDVEDR